MNPEPYRQLAELGVATVYEANGRSGLIDIPLIQLIPGSRAAGPARTVLCAQNDNLAVHAAIETIERGDVVVLAMPEPAAVALLGELLATQIQVRGAAAVLVDGAVRDVEELVRLGLPIWARYIRVRGATKESAGGLDVPVTVGGAVIEPGDALLLDADGAVCVRKEAAGAAIAAGRARMQREAALRTRLLQGETTYRLHGLDRSGVRPVDGSEK